MLSFCDPFPDIPVTLPFRATPMVQFSRNFGKLVLGCAEAKILNRDDTMNLFSSELSSSIDLPLFHISV